MRAQPFGPSRGNWISLATAAFSMTILAAVGLSYTGGKRCPLAAGPAPTAPGGRSPRTAGLGGARVFPATAGLALYYQPGTAAGSCELGPFRPGGLYASLPPARYAGGAACGSYLSVHGPRGNVLAEVVDLCPTCGRTTVNLSETAFGLIADPAPGSARVTFRQAADPPLPAPLVIHVIATSTPGLFAVQIRNHGNPLTSVAVAAAPAARLWRNLSLQPDDYWALAASAGSGPYDLRITDDQGHRVLLRRLALAPGETLRTQVWMYLPAAAGTRTRPASRASTRATVSTSGPGC